MPSTVSPLAESPQNLGDARLDEAVADHPKRQERSDCIKGPSELTQEYRQTDDKPDVSGREQEQARGGKPIDLRTLREERR